MDRKQEEDDRVKKEEDITKLTKDSNLKERRIDRSNYFTLMGIMTAKGYKDEIYQKLKVWHQKVVKVNFGVFI